MRSLYFFLFCIFTQILFSQCPGGATAASNGNCLYMTWSTQPDPLPTTLVQGGVTFTRTTALGVSPAIYTDGGACPMSTPSAFSGSLSIGGNTCTFANGTVLPVKLSFFDGVIKEGNVILNWQSLSETNNDKYNISWSVNAQDWKHIYSIKGEGSSDIKNDYSVELPLEKGVNYFKLNQIDFDGTISELGVQSFEYSGNNRFNIYPNPAANGITIDYNSKEVAEATITDILGRVIKKIMISSGEKIDITGLPIGNYNIHFKTSEGLDFNKVLSKI